MQVAMVEMVIPDILGAMVGMDVPALLGRKEKVRRR